MQMVFYSGGSFPADYTGDAFLTMRGSWNRKPASGYEVLRARFNNGQPQRFEPLVTGFLTDQGRTHIPPPMGLAVARDSALLMGDDANGNIYRVAYVGADARTAGAPWQSRLSRCVSKRRVASVSCSSRTGPRPRARRLAVSSSPITNGGVIPLKHSDYADGVSRELAWSAVPQAKSYAW